MAEIEWTEPALRDLEDIADYINITNPQAAKRFVQKVVTKTDRIAEHPLSGRHIPELENLSYREVIINPVRVFYKFEKDIVYILHVMRQEREFRRFLLSD